MSKPSSPHSRGSSDTPTGFTAVNGESLGGVSFRPLADAHEGKSVESQQNHSTTLHAQSGRNEDIQGQGSPQIPESEQSSVSSKRKPEESAHAGSDNDTIHVEDHRSKRAKPSEDPASSPSTEKTFAKPVNGASSNETQERAPGLSTSSEAHPTTETGASRLPTPASYTDVSQKNRRSMDGTPESEDTASAQGDAAKASTEESNATGGTNGEAPSKRKREFAHRTKTGCHTCRARKKKCGEEKPVCQNCIKGKFECAGYGDKPPIGFDKDQHRGSKMKYAQAMQANKELRYGPASGNITEFYAWHPQNSRQPGHPEHSAYGPGPSRGPWSGPYAQPPAYPPASGIPQPSLHQGAPRPVQGHPGPTQGPPASLQQQGPPPNPEATGLHPVDRNAKAPLPRLPDPTSPQQHGPPPSMPQQQGSSAPPAPPPPSHQHPHQHAYQYPHQQQHHQQHPPHPNQPTSQQGLPPPTYGQPPPTAPSAPPLGHDSRNSWGREGYSGPHPHLQRNVLPGVDYKNVPTPWRDERSSTYDDRALSHHVRGPPGARNDEYREPRRNSTLPPLLFAEPERAPYQTEREKMLQGQPYYHWKDEDLIKDRKECKKALDLFNRAALPAEGMTDNDRALRFRAVLEPSLREKDTRPGRQGKCGQHTIVDSPFYCDYGYNLDIGERVVINPNCYIQDPCFVKIGSRCIIGPNVSFFGMATSVDCNERDGSRGKFLGGGIRIEDDVVIGGNATILAYRWIGRGAVVAAGSVVTKNVRPYTVVAGNPAKYVRTITEGEGDRRANHEIAVENRDMIISMMEDHRARRHSR